MEDLFVVILIKIIVSLALLIYLVYSKDEFKTFNLIDLLLFTLIWYDW